MAIDWGGALTPEMNKQFKSDTVDWRLITWATNPMYAARAGATESSTGRAWQDLLNERVATSPTGQAQAAQIAQIEQQTTQSNERAQAASLAAERAQAEAAQRQKEIEAANIAAEAVRKANEAKKLFRGNMAQLSMNGQNENAPSVVGGATAYAASNQAEGAVMGRPRARRSALASQLGVGV